MIPGATCTGQTAQAEESSTRVFLHIQPVYVTGFQSEVQALLPRLLLFRCPHSLLFRLPLFLFLLSRQDFPFGSVMRLPNADLRPAFIKIQPKPVTKTNTDNLKIILIIPQMVGPDKILYNLKAELEARASDRG